MPNILDDNVVILRFDNSDFQKNTKDSMDALDRLKNSINGGDGLKGITNAANSVDLSHLSKSVDTIANRFSFMGEIGAAAIKNITDHAINSARNIATAIPRQMIQGGWKRALNIEQAEYLMKGLGVAFEGTFEKLSDGTEKIEGVKGAVLASVNQTRYGLDEAAKAASALMASDDRLKTNADLLAARLRAISGVAAVTSSDYESISYIFTKVAGQGRMMTNELNMLSQKGFNAAVEIQKYLNANGEIKDQALQNAIAMGKQTSKMQEIATHAELTEGDVREMVSAGAISFDIMSESLVHFFDTAKGANATYEGSFANVKASLSRMGAQLEEPKLKNMTKIFNYLLPVLNKIEELIKPLTSRIAEASSAVVDFIGKGLINPLGRALGVAKKDLFPGFFEEEEKLAKKTQDTNKQNQKSFKDTAAEILGMSKEYKAAKDIISKGKIKDFRKSLLTGELDKLGISYGKTQKIIAQYYKDGKKWDGVEAKLIKEYKEKTKASKEAGKAVKDQTLAYPPMVAMVKSFVNVISAGKLILKSFGNFISGIGKAIVNTLAPGLKLGANGLVSITDKMLDVSKKLSSFSENFKKKFPTGEWFSKQTHGTSGFFKSLTHGFGLLKELGSSAFEVIKAFISNISSSETFSTMKSDISGLALSLKELASGTIVDLINKLKELSSILNNKGAIGTGIKTFTSEAAELKNELRNLKDGVHPLKVASNTMQELMENTQKGGINGSTFNAAAKVIGDNGLVDNIVKASIKMQRTNVAKNLTSSISSINTFFSGIGKVAKKAEPTGGISNILDSFKSADWSEMSKIALRLASVAGILETAKNMGTLVESVSGTLGSLSGLFKSMTALTKAHAAVLKAKTFAMIATSIGILVGAIVALAMVPVDRLKPAIAGLVIIVGMVVAILAIFSSSKFNKDDLMFTAGAMLAIGASLFVLSLAAAKLAKIKPSSLAKASVALVGFLGAYLFVANRSKLAGKSTLSVAGLGAALLLLCLSIAILAKMRWGKILKGCAALMLIVGELVLASKISDMADLKGLVSLALALDLLLPAIFVLSIMPFDKALKGAILACSVIAMLGLASKAATGTAKTMTSMVVMSTTVGSLTAALVILSFLDSKKLLKAAASLSAVMLSIAAAGKVASTAKAGLITMSIAVALLSASIIALIKIDAEAAVKIAISLSEFAISMGLAMFAFSKIGIKGALIGIAGLAIAVAGITTIVAGLGFLNKSETIKKKIEQGGEFLEILGTALGKFISGIGIGVSSGLPEIGKNVSDFMREVQPFIDMAAKVDPDAAQGVKDLVSAILNLTKAEFLDQLSDFVGKADLTDFATMLVDFADAFIKFSKKVKNVDDDTIKKTKTVASALRTLTAMVNDIPRSNGVEQVFTGYIDTEKFADGIDDISKVCKKLGKLDLDVLKTAKKNVKPIASVVRTMADASKEIPPSGGAAQLFAGNTTIDEFAQFLADFIPNFKTFVKGADGLKIPDGFLGKGGTIRAICRTITNMAQASAEIPPSMGFKQLGLGNTTIDEFADQLTNAIPGIKKFITKIGSEKIKWKAVSKAIFVAKAVKELAMASQEIPESGGGKGVIFGGKDLGDFAAQLAEFIPGFTTFAQCVEPLKISRKTLNKIPKICNAIEAMAEVANALPDTGGWAQKLTGEKNLGDFGTKLNELITSISEIDGSVNVGVIKQAANGLEAILPAIENFKSAMPIPTGKNVASLGKNAATFAKALNGVETNKLSGKASSISSAISEIAKTARKGVKSLGKMSGFTSSGESLAKDFIKGLKKPDTAKAGKKIADTAALAARSKSIRTSMEHGGEYVGEGFVQGIKNKWDDAYRAGFTLGQKSVRGQKDGTKQNSPSKEAIKVGRGVGEGLVLGMESYNRKVYKAGYSMGKTSIEGQKQALIDTIDDISEPIITPVIDLDQARNDLASLDNTFSKNSAFGIGSRFESSSVRNNNMLNDLMRSMKSVSENQNQPNNYINIKVDGAENPEDFANRFLRQLELEMRTG